MARARARPTWQKDVKKHLNIFRIFVTFYGKPLEFRFFTQTLAKTGYTTIISAMHSMLNVLKSNKKKKKKEKVHERLWWGNRGRGREKERERGGRKKNSDSHAARILFKRLQFAIRGVPREMDTNGFVRWK